HSLTDVERSVARDPWRSLPSPSLDSVTGRGRRAATGLSRVQQPRGNPGIGDAARLMRGYPDELLFFPLVPVAIHRTAVRRRVWRVVGTAGHTARDFDCARRWGGGRVGVCARSAPGTWTAAARLGSGQGDDPGGGHVVRGLARVCDSGGLS